ncbi:MAG: hypothetical protein LQ340_007957, partial [Diploschistes diacapsis]
MDKLWELWGSDWLDSRFSLILLSISFILALAYLLPVFTGEDESAVPINVPVPEAAEAGWKGEVLVEPDIKVPGLSAIQCYCPATGQKLGLINPYTPEGIDRAIAAAKTAQPSWAKTTFAQRRKVLRTLLNFLLSNQLSLARVCARDSGKPLLDASYGEILVTASKLRWTLTHGEAALSPSRRPTDLLMCYKRNTVRYEPLGVVAALVSWNYPLHNFLSPLITALFAGNAIVLKPSERTAWSSAYFLSLSRACLVACGHSPQLVQSVPCWPSTAPHLTSHPDIKHITFIGSQIVAQSVLSAAATALTPVLAELGGKDPAILLDDIPDGELSKVVEILLRGTFQSAGQNCIGIERIVALPRTYERLLAVLPARVRALRVGPPLDSPSTSGSTPSSSTTTAPVDVGAMISPLPFDHLSSLISSAAAQGASLLAGGAPYTHPGYPSGHFFAPTLLASVTPAMPIARTELFAPVALLMRASSLAHAVEIANSTPYSLGASVFGESERDLQRVVAGVRAGMVSVNDFATYYVAGLPFGGVGGSGFGRIGGREGLTAVCCAKS